MLYRTDVERVRLEADHLHKSTHTWTDLNVSGAFGHRAPLLRMLFKMSLFFLAARGRSCSRWLVILLGPHRPEALRYFSSSIHLEKRPLTVLWLWLRPQPTTKGSPVVSPPMKNHFQGLSERPLLPWIWFSFSFKWRVRMGQGLVNLLREAIHTF